MSVDKFGRSTASSSYRKLHNQGPPGKGFKLTSEGNYDLENKILSNVQEPIDGNDAATLKYVNKQIFFRVELIKNDVIELNRNWISKFNVMEENMNTLEQQMQDSFEHAHHKFSTMLNEKLSHINDNIEFRVKKPLEFIHTRLQKAEAKAQSALDLANNFMTKNNLE